VSTALFYQEVSLLTLRTTDHSKQGIPHCSPLCSSAL